MSKYKIKILIIDDEPVMNEIVEARLLDSFPDKEIEILKATTYDDAIKALSEQRPQVALVDLNLGHKDYGDNLLREVRNLSQGTLPIVITGDYGFLSTQTCYNLGAFAIIRKPFDSDQFERVMREAFSNRERWLNLLTDRKFS